jgi:ATP-binding cassette, subfamily G (WHITE), member 2, SNQ2
MWATSLPDDRRQRLREGDNQANPWHDNREIEELQQHGLETREGTTAVPSPEGEMEGLDGTWGERDTGIESTQAAMQDFEDLKRELTTLSRTKSQKAEPPSLFRTLTGRSGSFVRGGELLRAPSHSHKFSAPVCNLPKII